MATKIRSEATIRSHKTYIMIFWSSLSHTFVQLKKLFTGQKKHFSRRKIFFENFKTISTFITEEQKQLYRIVIMLSLFYT